MANVSELLALSAQRQEPVRCIFRHGVKHDRACVCRGTMRILACAKCAGSGWDANRQRSCLACGGAGAYAASPAVKR